MSQGKYMILEKNNEITFSDRPLSDGKINWPTRQQWSEAFPAITVTALVVTAIATVVIAIRP